MLIMVSDFFALNFLLYTESIVTYHLRPLKETISETEIQNNFFLIRTKY